MKYITPLYKQIENGTFIPKIATPITEDERERIKAKYPNAYKSFELGLNEKGETDWVAIEPKFIK